MYSQDGNTALHSAAYGDYLDIVKLLLEQGSNPNSRNNVSQNMSKNCKL